MTTVAVCLPTLGRARQFEQRAGDLLAQPEPRGARLIVALSVVASDGATVAAAERLLDAYPARVAMFAREHPETAVIGWNLAYALASGADWFVLGADDIVWRAGWLQQALAVAAQTGAQVVGLNDGGHTNLVHYAPHYMASRWFCERVLGGHIAPPEYRSWWFDREICERAGALGLYAPAWDAWAEHMHPDWYQAEMDDTYRFGARYHSVDRVLYLNRQRRGFPNDIVARQEVQEVTV